MSVLLTDDDIARITELLYAGQKLAAIKIYCDATGDGLKEAKDCIDAIEQRLRAESPERFVVQRGSRGARRLFLIGAICAGAAAIWFFSNDRVAPPAPPARPKAVVNASDPATPVDMKEEEGPPSRIDLTGMWRLTLPAGFQHPTELKRLAEDRYEFRSNGVMNGEYVVRGNRLIMDKPNDEMQAKLWKFRWRIVDADLLELIGQPNPRTYGGQYLGATLERVKR